MVGGLTDDGGKANVHVTVSALRAFLSRHQVTAPILSAGDMLSCFLIGPERWI